MNLQNIENIYQLSFLQEAILLDRLKLPENDLCCEQLVYHLDGFLNISAWEQAWRQAIDRHSVLRTAFAWQRVEDPLQIVFKQVKPSLSHQDWRSLTASQQQEKLEEYVRIEKERGFNLLKPPLIRVSICQVDECTYQAIISYHALILDRHSVFLILQDVFKLYENILQNYHSLLAETYPYRDYVVWLREQDLSQIEVFWRQLLKGFYTPNSLVVDRVSRDPTNQTGNADKEVQLSAMVTTGLQTLAKTHHFSLKTLIQAAWAILLSRYNDRNDIVFGVNISNRASSSPKIKSMVGPLESILPIRVYLPIQEQLVNWLKEVEEQHSELVKHQHVSLLKLQSWSDISGGLPLFESIVVFEDFSHNVSCESLEMEAIRSLTWANYPLALIVKSDLRLSLRIVYSCKRFDTDVICRMLRHLETLLESISINPDQCLSTVSLISKAELHQLEEWCHA